MTPAFPSPAWLVGCGNMAGAMVEGWISAGVGLDGVTAIRPSGTPVPGVRTLGRYPDGEAPRFVMLGFKPQKLDEVAPDLSRHLGPGTILVSMLAGVSAASLRDRFGKAGAIMRIMPSLPVAEREGVIAVHAEDPRSEEAATVGALMAALGLVAWCETEKELGVIGAVAAAGVAYVARFAEALERAGERLGLPAELARKTALQTLVGTGAYASASGASMQEIARRVASPRGTTEQGLKVLDGPSGLLPLVEETLGAAVRRGEELAREAAPRN